MLRRLAQAGATVSVVVTLTVVLFVATNLLVQAAYETAIRTDLIETNPFLRKYGDAVQKANPNMDRAVLHALLRETWGHPAIYDPVVQFKEPAREGTYVNVAGFRRGLRQAVWPPQDDRPAVFIGAGFVWCAGIQDGVKKQLYTDSLHYMNLMNRRVAKCIIDSLPEGIKHTLRAQLPTG